MQSTHWIKRVPLLNCFQRLETFWAIQMSHWATKVLLILQTMGISNSPYHRSWNVVLSKYPSFITIIYSYKGRTWIMSALDPLFVSSLSSTDRDSSLVMIKMTEEELKVTFFLGLPPFFCDITTGLICTSLPTAGGSVTGLWHLSSRKHSSCKRRLRNWAERKQSWIVRKALPLIWINIQENWLNLTWVVVFVSW